MNEIINEFLLAGNKYMPEMHLKQPEFTYSACGPFTKTKEFKNLRKQEIQNICRNEFDKAYFQHDVVYEDFKDSETGSDKDLRDKAFNIAKNPKYHGYQRGLASMACKFFDKQSSGSGVTMLQNKQMAEELHKPIIRNLKKRTVYSGFKDNISVADLADMQLISKFNKEFRFLLCVIDIFS